MNERFVFMGAHPEARPPRTYALSIRVGALRRVRIGITLGDYARRPGPTHFQTVSMEQRRDIAHEAVQSREVARQRAIAETHPGGRPGEGARSLNMHALAQSSGGHLPGWSAGRPNGAMAGREVTGREVENRGGATNTGAPAQRPDKLLDDSSEQIDVLNDLSLQVPEGEFLLMGPSGSGKTTLLNLIAGLDKPSEGRIIVASEEISRYTESQLAKWRTRSVGFVFQFYNLLPVLTAYENVELPLLLLPLASAERRRQVLTALDLVGLSNRLSHRPGQLSGGQQQRVGIARALVTDPTLIVADGFHGRPLTRNRPMRSSTSWSS